MNELIDEMGPSRGRGDVPCKGYMKKEEIVTKLNTLERAWTSYIPSAAAVADNFC